MHAFLARIRRTHNRPYVKGALIVVLAIVALALKGERLSLTLLVAQVADMISYGLTGAAVLPGEGTEAGG